MTIQSKIEKLELSVDDITESLEQIRGGMNQLLQAVTSDGKGGKSKRRGRGSGSLAIINETESEHSGGRKRHKSGSGSVKTSE